MKQILAIFLKDARRFWPEILVSISLLIAFVLVYPATWRMESLSLQIGRSRFFGGEGPMGLLAGFLVVLIPIAWLVLVARAVHCERLVGDTQFWLTRPYTWWKLFFAKLLFLAAFLYVPFFIAQCALLHEGGFHPFHFLGGLLFNLLLLTAVGVLPLLALTSLTTGFGRLMLVLLGVTLVIVAAATASSLLPSDSPSGVPDLAAGKIGISMLFCGSLVAALIMYARRSAKTGWLVLAALTLAMCSTAFFDPDRALMNRYYPELSAGSAAPVMFAYGAKALNQPGASLSDDKHAVDIAIPLLESGVQDGIAANSVAVKAELLTASGERWESPWEGDEMGYFLSGDHATWIRLRMRRSVYDRFKATPVTLRISFAVAMARQTGESTIPLPTEDFAVPQIGVCKPTHWMWSPDQFSGLACRSAMNEPQLTHVSALWTSGGCKAEADTDRKQVAIGNWAGDLDAGPAEFGITSVWDANVNLSRPGPYYSKSNEAWSLCAGTPIRFTQYRPETRLREDMTIPGFKLPELSIGDRLMVIKPQ